VPHPGKASQGADSYFVAPSGTGVGVADGVGEWEWRFGCDPRAFADELMAGCLAAVELRPPEGEAGRDPGFSAYLAMRSGFGQARSFGSSTALVAALHSDVGVLGVASLGDSTLMQLRRGGDGLDTRFRVVARTLEQQHSFNCPFQLCRMPREEDIPRLLAEGKQKLARAVMRRPQVKEDLPEDARRYSLPVEEGDLLVVGTDGVFDNLHDHEICDLLASLCPEAGRASPERLAEAIVSAACERSRRRDGSSPFSVHARNSGYAHAGGKMDDVTCVCAWLVH